MKTLCVAVVVLSLTSVCQSAPLTCEQLTKPLDQRPDLSGRWYIIALNSEYCLLPVLLKYLFQPSVFIDLAAQATPNDYTVNYTFHTYEYCSSLVSPYPLVNCSDCGVDSNNGPKTLLYTSCPDCLIVKAKSNVYVSLLFSRRKTVTDAELKEFEALSECLGWVKPQVLNTDHENVNCTSLDLTDIEAVSGYLAKLVRRIERTHTVLSPSQCIDRDDYNHPPAGMEWVQAGFNHILRLQQH